MKIESRDVPIKSSVDTAPIAIAVRLTDADCCLALSTSSAMICLARWTIAIAPASSCSASGCITLPAICRALSFSVPTRACASVDKAMPDASTSAISKSSLLIVAICWAAFS